MQTENTLLRKKLRQYDALLMRVHEHGPQKYTGIVEQAFSKRFEGPISYGSGPLEFVGSPGTWGDIALKDGERALVFLSYTPHSGKYHQDAWHGHFSIADDATHAIANWQLLDESMEPWEPEYLRSAAKLLDPQIPWRVALPYRLLMRHLHEELALL